MLFEKMNIYTVIVENTDSEKESSCSLKTKNKHHFLGHKRWGNKTRSIQKIYLLCSVLTLMSCPCFHIAGGIMQPKRGNDDNCSFLLTLGTPFPISSHAIEAP